MKRQLDGSSEQFNNQPELQLHPSLQDALSQVDRQFDERSNSTSSTSGSDQ